MTATPAAARRRPVDPALYFVTDPALGDRLVPTVLAAVAGGASMVQLRDKHAGDAALVAVARRLMAALAPTGVPLIVNDRPAVAAAAGADGVHVGQEDGDPAAARAVVGPQALVGLSITAPGQVGAVDPAVVDHVGLGPVFATPSKPDHAVPLGLDGFAAAAARLPVPVVAIGGVTAGNAAALVAAGADGLAVVSAIAAAADPEAAARDLRRRIDEARARRAADTRARMR